MPTEIYRSTTVETIDGDIIYITPLKIKYMKQFMKQFDNIKETSNDIESMEVLTKCCAIAMRQYFPSIKTVEDVEDSFDMDSIYTIIDFGAGISLKKSNNPEEPVKPSKSQKGDSWEELDLAKLESEAFLLGIWKDYEELESSLSMQELSAILEAKRDAEYQDKKFLAAIQGVDLDSHVNGNGGKNEWEEMKARVASKISGVENSGANDITSYVGARATKAGFGIGMGLTYEKQ